VKPSDEADTGSTDLARARAWLAEARARAQSAATPNGSAHDDTWLRLELACEEVETKVLKREQYGRAIGTAEEELRRALNRLQEALSHTRKTGDATRPTQKKETQ